MIELSRLACSYQFPPKDGMREAREMELIFCFSLDTKVFNDKERS